MVKALRKFNSAMIIVFAGLATAGCGASDILSGDAKPFSNTTLFNSRDWANVTSATEISQTRPISAEDYVDANGACAGTAPVAEAAVGTVAGDLGTTQARPAAAAPTVAGGVALGMSECQVVQRAGQPNLIDIGSDGADRKAVLTYNSGNWPGIYTFVAGRLKLVDQVAVPEPVKPAPKKRTAKPRQKAAAL
jgi:outer membrane lipoprotein SlyB